MKKSRTAIIILVIAGIAVLAGAVIFCMWHGREKGQPPELYASSEAPHIITAEQTAATPEAVWAEDEPVASDFTLPEDMTLGEDDSIGVVSVPSVGIRMAVYETDDAMEDMRHGAAHFKQTSTWKGNVGLSGHNYKYQFGPLARVALGDIIIYETSMGTRCYQVTDIQEIDETDWSYLERTEENNITLITCVLDSPTKRLMVRGSEY